MANIIKRIWNQNRMVQIEDLKGMTFQAEQAGHTFQISGIDDDGNTVALTGTPAGVLLRPDNTDVALTCSVSGGVVSATLPANCYDVPGRFGLTIFITSGSSKTAIYAAVGTVTRTSSGTVAPGTSQSVVDLINAINAAVNSIPASYSALLADIAPTYSNSALYSVGQYAWYDGDLKRCIVPITTAESYTAAHWTSAVLGQDVSDLKSAIANANDSVLNPVSGLISFEQGRFDRTTGNTANSSAVIRTTDFIPENVVRISCSSSYKFIIWAWKKSDGTHVGHRTSDGSYGTASSYLYETDHIFDWNIGYKYKITFYNADSSNIEPSAGINCITWTATDKTLSKAEKAADAGAVGEMYDTLKNAISLGFEIPLMESHGYIKSSDGTLYPSNNQTYGYSVMCYVNPGEMYEYNFKVSDSVLGIAAYEDAETESADLTNSIAGNSSVTAIHGIYIVPDGIHAIRLCSQQYNAGKRYLKRHILNNKTVSILFVGNSLTQDGIAYLPYLLKNYYPEIDFKFYMWYHGGYTLAEHYDDFTNNRVAKIFSVAENTGSWTNYDKSKTMAWILSNYKFDMVCLEGYYNYTPPTKPLDDVTAFNNVRDYIQSNYTGGNGLEFITLFHAPLRSAAQTVYERTEQWNATYLQETIAQDMIPIGIAVYRALSTSLDSLGDQGHLSPDGTHTQEGLPCLLQTYTALCWLFDKLSINKSMYGFPFKMTTEIYETINVPGPNLGTGVIEGTDAQNLLAQEVAIKAYKEGKKFVMDNIYPGS